MNADYGEYGDVYGGISNKFGTDEEQTGLEELDQPETPQPPVAPVAPPTEIEQPPPPPPSAPKVEEQIVEPFVDEEPVVANEPVINQITEAQPEQDISATSNKQEIAKPVERIVSQRAEAPQKPAQPNREPEASSATELVKTESTVRVPQPPPPRVDPPTKDQQANWPVRQSIQQRAPAPVANGTSGRNYNSAGYTDTSGGATGYTDTTVESTLKCWHCDAMTFEDCQAKGEERPCHANEVSFKYRFKLTKLFIKGSCFLEIRERRDSNPFMQICMGCKAIDACENMQNQNFQNLNPDYTQCRPETDYSDSVCRQCCATDNCTKEPSWWYPLTREEWAYKG